MKTPILFTALRRSLLASLLWALVHALSATAQPSQYMTYQGYLTDGNGNPLGTTNTGPKAYNVVFRIWDVPTGGGSTDELHAEVQTVTVDNGYFSVLLGQGLKYLSEPFASPLSSIFTTTTAARYMEITVQGIGVGGANITILPRLQLVSSPYSFLAANAQNVTGNGVITAANIAQNTITGADIASGTITDGNMVPNTITSASIAPGTIQGANIAGGTITGGNIAGGTIGSGNIASGTIIGDNIASGTVTAANLSSSIGVWTTTGSGNNISRMSGFVGINTTTPAAWLDVEGIAEPAGGVNGPYFSALSGSTLGNYGAGTTEYVSIKSQWYVLGYGFIAQSDKRIKDIVGQADPATDLATIQRLKVTDYRMKDHLVAGDKLHKGFIAQEVQEVLPQAINKTKDYIPNIYVESDKLDFDSGAQTLRVGLGKAHGLKKGDKVRLMEEDATLEREVLATPDEKTFVVGAVSKAPKRVFVYGKRVDDFLAVDYNQIFSAGIGAIQDLAVRVEKLEVRQDEMSDLKKQAARVESLDREVAELKETVAQLVQANKAVRQTADEQQQPHSLMAASLNR